MSFVTVGEALEAGQEKLRAPGTYGYFLSRAGAAQLIARCDEDGFHGDVDWRITAYCTPPDLPRRLTSAASHLARWPRRMSGCAPRGRRSPAMWRTSGSSPRRTPAVSRVDQNTVEDAHEVFAAEEPSI